MIKASRDKRVEDIKHSLRGFHITEDFDIGGAKWRLRTMTPAEIAESDAWVNDSTSMQAGRSLARAQVACALTHINGVPIEELFTVPKEGDPEELKRLEDPETLRLWRKQQVWDFLMHETQDEVLILLWESYVALLKRKRAAMEGLSGFSKGIPSTAPSPT